MNDDQATAIPAAVREYLVRRSTGDFGSDHHRRRLRIFDKTGGFCWHCKNPLGFDWHADHLIPRAAGGSNAIENMVPSCPSCNHEKADQLGWQKNPVGFERETQA
jgi:5-methylcytosine-specific restriction endonuclease McrA